MNKDHFLKACSVDCPPFKILDLGANPSVVKRGGSTTIHWLVENWDGSSPLILNGVNVAPLTNFSTMYGEKTFNNIIVDTDYNFSGGNDCPTNASASVTVTLEPCDKCGETGIHDDGGSDTKNWNNIAEGNFSKEVTVYNNGYCNWPNFLIKAKVEEQQGSNLRARNEMTINLPARSSITIQINYNNTSRTISFVIGPVTPLSTFSPMSLNDLSGFNDIDPGKKVILTNNEGFGTIQCVYLKMQFATECGANF
jgi:hypothetical protein